MISEETSEELRVMLDSIGFDSMINEVQQQQPLHDRNPPFSLEGQGLSRVMPQIASELNSSNLFLVQDFNVQVTTNDTLAARNKLLSTLKRHRAGGNELKWIVKLFLNHIGDRTSNADKIIREHQSLKTEKKTIDLKACSIDESTNIDGLRRVNGTVYEVLDDSDAIRSLVEIFAETTEENDPAHVALLDQIKGARSFRVSMDTMINEKREQIEREVYLQQQKEAERLENERLQEQLRLEQQAKKRLLDEQLQQVLEADQSSFEDLYNVVSRLHLNDSDAPVAIMKMLAIPENTAFDDYQKNLIVQLKTQDGLVGHLAQHRFPRVTVRQVRYDNKGLGFLTGCLYKQLFGDEDSKEFYKSIKRLQTEQNKRARTEALDAKRRRPSISEAEPPAKRQRVAEPTVVATYDTELLAAGAEAERLGKQLTPDHEAAVRLLLNAPADRSLSSLMPENTYPATKLDSFLLHGLIYTARIPPELEELAEYIADDGLVAEALRRQFSAEHVNWLRNRGTTMPRMANLIVHKESRQIIKRNQLILEAYLDRLVVAEHLCHVYGSDYMHGEHPRVPGAIVAMPESISDWVIRNTRDIEGITKNLREHLIDRYINNDLEAFPTRRDWTRDYILYQDGYVCTRDPRFCSCQTPDDFAALLVRDVPEMNHKLPFFVRDIKYSTVIEKMRTGLVLYDGLMTFQGYGDDDRVPGSLSSKEMIMGLMGGMYFEIGQHDNWNFMTCIYGHVGGTGKTSFLKAVLQDAYPPDQTCGIDTSGPSNRFRFNEFLTVKGAIIDTDAPDCVVDLVGATDFQKAVEGGQLSIEVKNVKGKKNINCKMKWCSASNNPVTKKDASMAIQRRVMQIQFNNKSPAEDERFKKRLSDEEGPSLQLIALANYWRLVALCKNLHLAPTADNFPLPCALQKDKKDSREQNNLFLQMLLGTLTFDHLNVVSSSSAWISAADFWRQLKNIRELGGLRPPDWHTLFELPEVKNLFPYARMLKDHHCCIHCQGPHRAGCCGKYEQGEKGRRSRKHFIVGIRLGANNEKPYTSEFMLASTNDPGAGRTCTTEPIQNIKFN